MELVESQHPEKKKLIEASERHKRALENNFLGLSGDTKKLATNALIIGGVLALSYIAVRSFSSSSKPKKHKKYRKVTVVQPAVSRNDEEVEEEPASHPGLLTDIGMKVANQATIILIDLARQKLMEFLEGRLDKSTKPEE